MNKPDSVLVPTRPNMSPTGQDRTGEDRTRTTKPLDSSSWLPTHDASRVYATVGEEAAAWQKRIVQAWFEDEVVRLQAEYRRSYEQRMARLEEMRDRQFRECERDCGVGG